MDMLSAHYQLLYENAVQEISAGRYETDPLIDDPADTRRGLTLLIRPNEIVKKNVLEFLGNLEHAVPGQYYYPATDMHVTVLAIISAVPGFKASEIAPEAYAAVIQSALAGYAPFDIHFRGLTASPAGVLVQGFVHGNALNGIRDKLRAGFKSSPLRQSMDARYNIQTAHMTAARLRQPLASTSAFLDAIARYRQTDFGHMSVQTMELVYNDWYQRARHTLPLGSFSLG